MTERECTHCHGRRLRPESLAVTVDGLSIDKVTDLPWVRLSTLCNA
jgi:excinuclease ABC subunit A